MEINNKNNNKNIVDDNNKEIIDLEKVKREQDNNLKNALKNSKVYQLFLIIFFSFSLLLLIGMISLVMVFYWKNILMPNYRTILLCGGAMVLFIYIILGTLTQKYKNLLFNNLNDFLQLDQDNQSIRNILEDLEFNKSISLKNIFLCNKIRKTIYMEQKK
ncbi:hypothetical protein [Mycoplasma sp. Mirounga ES2805-ORL]|uniref:hypothetical protein n=1 Tax=Mycoplasma sp. Mirounga ES2805-ORL TaxID=754514 RepID=UPI00197C2494|nr:hypothetical protein [Mycoplasma sp. Mirounga ES2805-ORL]QSF13414.1 hypothetical protein JXZ90_01925 [Mycoplasma sp. Mirounga ES2805-ORL]